MRLHSFLSIVIVCAICAFTASPLTAQHNYGGTSGHLPFAHDHSGNCGGQSGGVCYGYAMGRLGEASSPCNPSTMIPEYTCNNFDAWAGWGVIDEYFEHHSDATLNVSGPIIIDFGGNHVAYCSSGASGGPSSITIYHVRTSGQSDTIGTAYKQGSYSYYYNWTQSGYGSYNSTGYWTIRNINTQAQNNFFNGATPVTDHGTISLSDSSGTSPFTKALKWTQSQTATATDLQDYPTGYKQVFNASWTQNGVGAGSTLQIPITVRNGASAYQANFYEATPITFAPTGGGGGVSVDSQSWYSSHIKYAKINPTPADQVSAQAVPTAADDMNYVFAYWTNSNNGDIAYTSAISFYASVPITYTAHFTAKPEAPTSLNQVASIGQNVHLTWTDNPNTTRVTQYHIYRSCEGGEERNLVATAYKGLQSWTDPDVTVKGTKDGPLITYDVCGVDSVTSNEGDCASVSQYGYYVPRIVQPEEPKAWNESAEIPKEYSVGSYPNPFNPSTTISYSLPNNSSVKLDIYDVAGRKVRSLLDEGKSAGYHNVVWNGRDENGRGIASGMYLYRFTATPINGEKAFTQSGKLLLMK